MCPGWTFTSTASKTCILFFTKKKERKDVVEIKGKKRHLEFIKSHSTKKVKFYDFNPDTEGKHFIKEVDIKDIASNNYSLNYTVYNIEEEEEIKEEGIEWIELEKCCKINYGDRIVKKNTVSGEFDVYGGGDKTFTTDTFNREGYNILIARFALSKKCVRLLDKKFYLNDSGLTITINENKGNNKYIGYYLILNQNTIYKLARGTGQQNLDMDNFKKIKIPIIPIEKQNKIVKFLDELYEDKQIKIQDTATYYESHDIFRLLLDKKYNNFKNLVIAQEFEIKLSDLNKINTIEKDLLILENTKKNIIKRINNKDEEKLKYEYITYKDKEYILEDEVYEINSDGTKGQLFGTYKNNKLKKCKKEVTEIEV